MEKDYKGDTVKVTTKTCENCGKTLNQTEVEESEEYLGGERYVCTPRLNQLMDLGQPKGCQ